MDEHTPVLVEEALEALALRPGGLYVDATFGRGGHTARILEALGSGGEVVAIDRDPAAIAAGRARFAHEARLQLVHGEFGELATLVHAHTTRTHCDGALFDFGVASPQLDAINAIREIKSGDSKNTTVIGYVDHTRADVIEAARAAGCDQVMSKGEFAKRLPELLEGI